MVLLSLKNLKLSYDDNVVIKDASLTLEEGDFACVVGANGSGKSTLIRGILGLIKPQAGEVKYGGDLDHTKIGYLPQESRADSNFPATVEEVVLSGCLGHMQFRPFYHRDERDHAANSLKTLGISKLKKKSFSSLSGGQKQKVLLARSLSATERLLVLDEPSNNLDYDSRKDFYKTLKKLNKEYNLTIIMITHDLDADDLIGNKVIAIDEGVVKMTTTEKYLEGYQK
ncbi:ATP-binding cassette domain-containing protein [Candidatus Saccharibacteria bacterium]|nr:ATP-binding cassette domain-containing protein [Candidatus Saccharibacteria bacterium]